MVVGDQGKEYSALIQSELKFEHERRDLVNSRAATAVNGVSGLVTIVLAIFAVILGKDYHLEGAAEPAIVIALVALLVAAIMAVAAGFSWRQRSVSIKSLETMLGTHWTDDETDARNNVAFCNLQSLQSLRVATNIKYSLLVASSIAQVVALGALAVCAIIVAQ